MSPTVHSADDGYYDPFAEMDATSERNWVADHPGYSIQTPPGFLKINRFPVCDRCGSLVVNTTKHDERCPL
jgi:hypothetical protein